MYGVVYKNEVRQGKIIWGTYRIHTMPMVKDHHHVKYADVVILQIN
jgi:hypothetical protein